MHLIFIGFRGPDASNLRQDIDGGLALEPRAVPGGGYAYMICLVWDTERAISLIWCVYIYVKSAWMYMEPPHVVADCCKT